MPPHVLILGRGCCKQREESLEEATLWPEKGVKILSFQTETNKGFRLSLQNPQRNMIQIEHNEHRLWKEFIVFLAKVLQLLTT